MSNGCSVSLSEDDSARNVSSPTLSGSSCSAASDGSALDVMSGRRKGRHSSKQLFSSSTQHVLRDISDAIKQTNRNLRGLQFDVVADGSRQMAAVSPIPCDQSTPLRGREPSLMLHSSVPIRLKGSFPSNTVQLLPPPPTTATAAGALATSAPTTPLKTTAQSINDSLALVDDLHEVQRDVRDLAGRHERLSRNMAREIDRRNGTEAESRRCLSALVRSSSDISETLAKMQQARPSKSDDVVENGAVSETDWRGQLLRMQATQGQLLSTHLFDIQKQIQTLRRRQRTQSLDDSVARQAPPVAAGLADRSTEVDCNVSALHEAQLGRKEAELELKCALKELDRFSQLHKEAEQKLSPIVGRLTDVERERDEMRAKLDQVLETNQTLLAEKSRLDDQSKRGKSSVDVDKLVESALQRQLLQIKASTVLQNDTSADDRARLREYEKQLSESRLAIEQKLRENDNLQQELRTLRKEHCQAEHDRLKSLQSLEQALLQVQQLETVRIDQQEKLRQVDEKLREKDALLTTTRTEMEDRLQRLQEEQRHRKERSPSEKRLANEQQLSAKLKAELDQLKLKHSTLLSQFEKLREELESSLRVRSELDSKLAQMSTKLEQANERCADLVEENADLKTQNSNLSLKLESQSSELNSVKCAKEVLSEKLNDAKRSLMKADLSVEQLTTQLDGASKENERCRSELNELRLERQHLISARSKVEADLSNTHKTVDQTVDALSAEIKEMKAVKEALEKEVAFWREKLDSNDLDWQEKYARTELDLDRQCREAKAALLERQAELCAQREHQRQLVADLDRYKVQIGSLESENGQLQRTINALKDDLNSSLMKASDELARLKQFEEKHLVSQNQVKRAERRYQTILSAIAEQIDQCYLVAIKVTGKLTDVHSVGGSHAQVLGSLTEKDGGLDRWTMNVIDRLTQVSRELESKAAECEELRKANVSKIEGHGKERQKLLKQHEQLTSRIKVLTEEKGQAIAENAHLASTLDALQRESVQMRKVMRSERKSALRRLDELHLVRQPGQSSSSGLAKNVLAAGSSLCSSSAPQLRSAIQSKESKQQSRNTGSLLSSGEDEAARRVRLQCLAEELCRQLEETPTSCRSPSSHGGDVVDNASSSDV